MKLFALVAACALALPGVADARDSSRHRSHSGHRHSSSSHHHRGHDHHRGHHHHHHSSRYYYPSYGYGSYGYRSYGYYPYYRSYPSVSFIYSSASPRYYSSAPSYRSTADSLEVDVQRELKRRGYYRGPIDGDIGPGSRSAIRAYQADRGLAVTGRIDARLLRSLGI